MKRILSFCGTLSSLILYLLFTGPVAYAVSLVNPSETKLTGMQTVQSLSAQPENPLTLLTTQAGTPEAAKPDYGILDASSAEIIGLKATVTPQTVCEMLTTMFQGLGQVTCGNGQPFAATVKDQRGTLSIGLNLNHQINYMLYQNNADIGNKQTYFQEGTPSMEFVMGGSRPEIAVYADSHISATSDGYVKNTQYGLAAESPNLQGGSSTNLPFIPDHFQAAAIKYNAVEKESAGIQYTKTPMLPAQTLLSNAGQQLDQRAITPAQESLRQADAQMVNMDADAFQTYVAERNTISQKLDYTLNANYGTSMMTGKSLDPGTSFNNAEDYAYFDRNYDSIPSLQTQMAPAEADFTAAQDTALSKDQRINLLEQATGKVLVVANDQHKLGYETNYITDAFVQYCYGRVTAYELAAYDLGGSQTNLDNAALVAQDSKDSLLLLEVGTRLLAAGRVNDAKLIIQVGDALLSRQGDTFGNSEYYQKYMEKRIPLQAQLTAD